MSTQTERLSRVPVVVRLVSPVSSLSDVEVLQLAAQWSVDNFGLGGNPTAERIEDYLGFCNTPRHGDYLKFMAAPQYATQLELMSSQGAGPIGFELIRVEWLDKEPVGGWPDITYDEDVIDEGGNPITLTRKLGKIT